LTERVVIDGSYGEGGGQILRTALTLSALSGRRLGLTDIRAGRPKPGLAAQHLTAVRGAGALCGARIEGDALGSRGLDFAPRRPARTGDYLFDVAAAREGGSAGATTLVLQTVLLPLALADGESRVLIRGGTHMAWSPSFDYVRDVWLPALVGMGVEATVALGAWGWFPVGKGEIRAAIHGLGKGWPERLRPLELCARGPLRRVFGRAVAANLPSHIAQRMADRARGLLDGLGVEVSIIPRRVSAACAGAGLFLTADYDGVRGGFTALGARGKRSEEVAEEAAAALLAHRDSGAVLERHLADQIVVPLALAAGPSRFTVERVTNHLRTNARVLEWFGLARVDIETREDGTGLVTVLPQP
jgi:RNA 3'-terminal phosphate cyclase (ATP)